MLNLFSQQNSKLVQSTYIHSNNNNNNNNYDNVYGVVIMT